MPLYLSSPTGTWVNDTLCLHAYRLTVPPHYLHCNTLPELHCNALFVRTNSRLKQQDIQTGKKE